MMDHSVICPSLVGMIIQKGFADGAIGLFNLGGIIALKMYRAFIISKKRAPYPRKDLST